MEASNLLEPNKTNFVAFGAKLDGILVNILETDKEEVAPNSVMSPKALVNQAHTKNSFVFDFMCTLGTGNSKTAENEMHGGAGRATRTAPDAHCHHQLVIKIQSVSVSQYGQPQELRCCGQEGFGWMGMPSLVYLLLCMTTLDFESEEQKLAMTSTQWSRSSISLKKCLRVLECMGPMPSAESIKTGLLKKK
eukprot:scaffold345_cov44-Attheya_sp.AAC.5